jgi:diaminohydroxyphosphoribosylaminopyrimidine deaminase/5-amino-6-(5-phosphoribosylamino)uracil reductase
MVGAVVVRAGRIVGSGMHRRFGGPHAEVFALDRAGKAARGATLYVTLEPCCHWGKTPPCTDAIREAGIARVVVGMQDPFAKVHGKGIATLRRAGIRVDVAGGPAGSEGARIAAEARALNAPFITRLTEGRPFVIAKWAQSLDGAVATASGESRWISSEASREEVQELRSRVDAVIVGIGTALADDPLLTARLPGGRGPLRLATRIVIDSTCRLPLTSRLVATVHEQPVMVAHRGKLTGSAERRRRALEARGVMMAALPAAAGGRVRIASLLKYLGRLEYANVLVEGGPETMASFVAAGCIDEAHVFIAPIVIGGAGARRAIGGKDLDKLAHARRLRIAGSTRSGADLHLVLWRP